MLNKVDGSLFTNNPQVDIPDWINGVEFKQSVQRTVDVPFDKNIINQKHVMAERYKNVGVSRDLSVSLNDNQFKIYAMAKLAKLLNKYRYKAVANVKNGHAIISVNFENNPMDYTFEYNENNGDIIGKHVFIARLADVSNEYPFSVAGIEDSFADINNFKCDKSMKVKKATVQYNIMTRYDIVQRCNNQLEKARDLIKKNIEEGNIVAVGSNEYASTYDLNYLFPDLRKQFAGEASHTFEFVNNKVATASYENKSANRLALEASNILNDTFKVNKIIKAGREDNNLYVTAELLHNNMRDTYNFNFTIENEKVAKLNYIENADCERFTVAQLFEQFGESDEKIVAYLNNSNEHIAGGYVYSIKTIKARLNKYISNVNINNMMNMWESNDLVTKLNSTTYASKYSMGELLKNTNVEFFDKDTIANIRQAQIKFGEQEHFYSVDVKDNDTRNNVANKRLADVKQNIVNIVNKHFKSYDISDVNNNRFVLSFKSNDGRKRVLTAEMINDNVVCNVGDSKISIADLADRFKQSPLLKQYLLDNDVSNNDKIIISTNMFYTKLADYISADNIKKLIGDLEENKQLVKLSENKYASKCSFDDLLRNYNGDIDLSLKEQNLSKKNKVADKVLEADYIQNNDTRTATVVTKKQQQLDFIKSIVDKYLKNYDLNMIDDNHIVISCKIDSDKKRNILGTITDNGIYCTIGNKEIEISKLAERFAKSKILSAYLVDHKSEEIFNVILSDKTFADNIGDLVSKEKIAKLIKSLLDNGYMEKISSNKYASRYSFNDLLRKCKFDVDVNLKSENLIKKNKVADKVLEAEYISDNDTRNVEKQITESELKEQFINLLPENIECIAFNKVNINGNKAKLNVTLFNKNNGIRADIQQNIDSIKNGKIDLPNPIYSQDVIDGLFKTTTATKTFNKFSSKITANKIIISKKELVAKLERIINLDNLDNVIDSLIAKKYLTKIASNQYASEFNLEELISKSNLQSYTDEQISDNFKKAKVNANIIPKSFHIEDSSNRDVQHLEDGRTKEKIVAIKNEYHVLLNDMVSNYKITTAKQKILMDEIEKASNFVELDTIYKKIIRYNK